MFTDSFDYILPDGLIAREPLSPRDSCRLMALNREHTSLEHRTFSDLPQMLRPGDVLVFNDSKVIPARLILLYKNREVELLLTRRLSPTDWLALVRPGRLFTPGAVFDVGEGLKIQIMEIHDDGQRVIRFSEAGRAQESVLRKIGQAPYPPYIRDTRASFQDYQTVYAEDEGSIAAPTAGLHFTHRLLDELKDKGVQQEFVTLHVGLGTFLPIKAEKIEDHFMHYERYSLDRGTADRLNTARHEGRRLIAVGTTCVRVLEDSYEPGLGFRWGERETNLYIYPGYEWRCVDALITNFHLPKSSLLLLVSAFAGREFVMEAYREAIASRYRFYSFGDAMFIE